MMSHYNITIIFEDGAAVEWGGSHPLTITLSGLGAFAAGREDLPQPHN
jgi:hypothetical protein